VPFQNSGILKRNKYLDEESESVFDEHEDEDAADEAVDEHLFGVYRGTSVLEGTAGHIKDKIFQRPMEREIREEVDYKVTYYIFYGLHTLILSPAKEPMLLRKIRYALPRK